MSETYLIVPEDKHTDLVKAAYQKRGFDQQESEAAAKFCNQASRHGIRTHNAIKALHLDERFGSGSQGCVPGAEIEVLPSRFTAVQVWDAHRKLGQSTAYRALETCIELADIHGVGIVAVDNAFHYLWGGGYMIEAAQRGYLAYTNCTAALAEVVPFQGKTPTLGTNPHSWGFPTTEAVGFPIVVDWATSVVAMGRVQQFKREGKQLPPNAAVDASGEPTTDPNEAVALLPFGAHKGYGLALINEIVAAFVGGSLPTLRSVWKERPEKKTPCFYFQVVHPDAVSSGRFHDGRNQSENIKLVLEDILGKGNESCLLPGQIEAEAASKTDEYGGLLFTDAEMEALDDIARESGYDDWDASGFRRIDL